MTSILTQDEPIDSWEDIPSDDEVEDLVEEEVSKEVVDPNKEKREALQKAIRKLNVLIFLNNEKLEDLKKSSKELLLNRKKTWFINNKPIQGHWLFWLFYKNYLRKFPEKDTIIINGKSVYNMRGKRMIPQWKKTMMKKVSKWGNSTNSKSYIMEDLENYYPTCIPAEAQGPKNDLKKLLTATGAPPEKVKEYILFKWEEIKETVAIREKELKEKIRETQEKVNNLNKELELLK
tara:strand:- start:555 stop:1256 length:702 start_codon:yes stop_codon:yes gene_type:complete